MLLGAESEVSFETYFNAFAAAYWRRWSILDSVVLRVEVTGTARVDLYRSKIDGSRIGIGGDLIATDENGRGVAEFELDLGPFEDGGWIWFDITTDTDTEIVSAGWYSPIDAPTSDADTKRVTIGIPTFNRPTDAVNALAALTSDPMVDEVIDAVMMPDQGTKKVVDEPGYTEAAAALGDRLHIFDQATSAVPAVTRASCTRRCGSPIPPRTSSTWTTTSRSSPTPSSVRSRCRDSPSPPPCSSAADAQPAGPQSPALHG